jgi:hypothetical protein
MESILTTIKLMLGYTEDCKHFDTPIIVHINKALMRLSQLGVGPKKPVRISDDLNTWDELLLDSEDLEGAKEYIYLEVKKIFDPPTSSFVLESMKNESDKLEWCLNVQAETEEVVTDG